MILQTWFFLPDDWQLPNGLNWSIHDTLSIFKWSLKPGDFGIFYLAWGFVQLQGLLAPTKWTSNNLLKLGEDWPTSKGGKKMKHFITRPSQKYYFYWGKLKGRKVRGRKLIRPVFINLFLMKNAWIMYCFKIGSRQLHSCLEAI